MYQHKYEKYKKKYLILKQTGGASKVNIDNVTLEWFKEEQKKATEAIIRAEKIAKDNNINVNDIIMKGPSNKDAADYFINSIICTN